MGTSRTAILLAPIGLVSAPPRSDFASARTWQTGRRSMRPLLGEAFSFDIALEQIASAKLEESFPAGIELAETGHECVVFRSGVAIIQVQLQAVDGRALLRRWEEGHENALTERMYAIGSRLLPGRLDPARADVDWTYALVDTDRYIDDQFDNDAAQDASYAGGRDIPEALALGNKAGTRMWVDWSSTQVVGLEALASTADLPRASIVDVFVVRCACWQLLTSCGQRAVKLLATVDSSHAVVVELRRLQMLGSQLLISYHTSLWTTDRYLVRVFDAVDAAWYAEREVAKTRDILERVATVLATQHAAELERRNGELESRDRILAGIATSLAVLTLVSAIADMFALLDRTTITGTWAAVIAILIPVIFALGALRLMRWWAVRASSSRPSRPRRSRG